MLPRLALTTLCLLCAVPAQTVPATNSLEFFETAVRPILARRCHECHGPDKQKSTLRLDHIQHIMKGGERGPALVPGVPDASRLLRAIGYSDPDLQMPPRERLPDEERETLRRWIADGANWPDEPLFLRRSFEDPLYKVVFRTYVAYLIKQGFTQEFFIEGGRSRTGKTLAPRLGMVAWNVDAFLTSARRDLFFVPIAITYERLVEEGSLVGEIRGDEKEDESVMGLVRARKFLRRRFGSVCVNFGEPVSLADALGDQRAIFVESDSEEAAQHKRKFVEGLGNRIAERINWAVVPNATSVAACALLGAGRRGFFREDLAARMQEVVDLLRLQDVRLTPALDRDEGPFRESIGSLLRNDLIRSAPDPRGEVLYFEEGRRAALDLYRNAIVHYLATPSFLARRLLAGIGVEELRSDLSSWLDLFYYEFFTPIGEVLAAHFEAFIDHFERFGWMERSNGDLRATEKGVAYFEFLSEQTRGVVEVYYATASAVFGMEEKISSKDLRKAARDQLERSELLGEVVTREPASDTTFANAVTLMEEAWDHCARSAGPRRRDLPEVRVIRRPPGVAGASGVRARRPIASASPWIRSTHSISRRQAGW